MTERDNELERRLARVESMAEKFAAVSEDGGRGMLVEWIVTLQSDIKQMKTERHAEWQVIGHYKYAYDRLVKFGAQIDNAVTRREAAAEGERTEWWMLLDKLKRELADFARETALKAKRKESQ